MFDIEINVVYGLLRVLLGRQNNFAEARNVVFCLSVEISIWCLRKSQPANGSSRTTPQPSAQESQSSGGCEVDCSLPHACAPIKLVTP